MADALVRGPSDDAQFETMDAGHFLYLLLDSQEPNPLFHAPVEDPRDILDIGTGSGTWAIDTADKFPEALVTGVDLMPPSNDYMPPNCVLEVDDVTEAWTWQKQFDLIHLRLMLGAWTPAERAGVYRQCLANLKPGGWIEEVELDVRVMCDDGTMAEDPLIARWGQTFLDCAERAGRPLSTQLTMKEQIEAAGFVDVREQLYKCPIGRWPKDKILKEVCRIFRKKTCHLIMLRLEASTMCTGLLAWKAGLVSMNAMWQELTALRPCFS